MRCNPSLKEEWKKYLDQTRSHVTTLEEVCKAMGLDPKQETPGRAVVRHLGGALVTAMKMALEAGKPEAAQLVACECVVLAETKDHPTGSCSASAPSSSTGRGRRRCKSAYDEIEDQEDEHLYHTKGWCRELWIQSLGMKAVLPPPEEVRHVKTAIGAAKAEQAAEKLR